MIKVKDGYAKLVGTTASGSASHILLSNGGIKAVSDFAAASALDNYLPLSGGTISGSLVIQASSPGVTFKKSNALNPFASLGIYSNKLSMYVNSENKYYDILHSGNVDQYTIRYYGNQGAIDFDNVLYNGVQYTSGSSVNGGKHYGALMSLWVGDTAWQIVGGRANEGLMYRSGNGTSTSWTAWKTIAFTDSNVASATQVMVNYSYNQDINYPLVFTSRDNIGSAKNGVMYIDYSGRPTYNPKTDTLTVGNLLGNASSATKLQTPRTIWGQSFDGAGNVSGNILLGVGSDYAIGTGYSSSDKRTFNNITIGNSTSGIVYNGGTWTGSKSFNAHTFTTGASSNALVINNGGNVGIGTTSPTKKLHIYSDSSSYDSLVLLEKGGAYDVRFELANSIDALRVIQQSSGNAFISLNGNHSLNLETSNTVRFTIDGSGNVGIGTTSPSYKLDVNGNIAATSSINSVRLIPDADCGIFMKSNGQWLHIAGSGNKMLIYNGEWDSSGKGNYNKGIVISTSNNVGIGTESPVHKLDVNGSIYGSHYYGDAITLYTRGNGTYTRAWITAKDSAGDFIIEAPLTAESSGTRAPITLTWRGGYPSMGGLKITGYSEAVLGGNKIWHEGNDGSGSGLDADLLDGKHLSSFITYELSTGYVGASFNSEDLSKKAASTYIEYWDGAGGWFNSRWGLVLAISGFHRVGSSDSYVLLGGGGHKALSDFAAASHNHNGSYVYTGGMVNGACAVIPTYNGETGWHRIATIDGGTGYGSWILYLCGNWSWASNTNAILHINTMHTEARITQVSGIVGFVTDVRLVPISANNYYVDVYINYSGANTPGTVYCYFLGNGAITTRTTAEKITASVSTAASITLVTGTKTNDSSYAAHFYENSDIRYKTIINNLVIKANQLANLPLFNFKWLDNENLLNTGTSAQAVQELLPYIVSGTDKLTLDYGVLGTIAGITACKELTEQEKEINELKEQIKFLKDEINNLKTNKLWQS